MRQRLATGLERLLAVAEGESDPDPKHEADRALELTTFVQNHACDSEVVGVIWLHFD